MNGRRLMRKIANLWSIQFFSHLIYHLFTLKKTCNYADLIVNKWKILASPFFREELRFSVLSIPAIWRPVFELDVTNCVKGTIFVGGGQKIQPFY